jgi:hypothetical protein
MIRWFLISFSYIFHPLFIPAYTTTLFYIISPKFIPKPELITNLFSLILLSCFFPLIVYVILLKFNKVSTIHLKNPKERIIPLVIQAITYIMIGSIIFQDFKHLELKLFFWASGLSALIALVFALKNIKASLHMIALSAPVVFCVFLSILYQINILKGLILGTILIALTCISRLIMKAHNLKEIIWGIIIGIVPQLMMFLFYKI